MEGERGEGRKRKWGRKGTKDRKGKWREKEMGSGASRTERVSECKDQVPIRHLNSDSIIQDVSTVGEEVPKQWQTPSPCIWFLAGQAHVSFRSALEVRVSWLIVHGLSIHD